MSNNTTHSFSKDVVVYLGETGFPRGLAAIQRLTLISKALCEEDYRVIVMCRKGVMPENEKPEFPVKGKFEGIDYVYTSGTIIRPSGFIKRNFLKIKGMLAEYRYLYQLKKTGNIKAALLANHKAIHVLRYRMYSHIIGFPLILGMDELLGSIPSRKSIATRINDFFYDRISLRSVDGALPISELLVQHYKTKSRSKPVLKLPVLCDFEVFHRIERKPEDRYFLYCGSIAYGEVIQFIAAAYEHIADRNNVKMYMIISGGNKKQLGQLQQEIGDKLGDANIRLFSNIPYEQLVQLYRNAAALLIPLRPTLQDSARFPHKIGEYLAAANPVITTAFGEINNYDFIDKHNALIAKDYTVSSFAEKMKFVIDNPKKAEEIGKRGREMGLKNFHYANYGKVLKNYLSTLAHKGG